MPCEKIVKEEFFLCHSERSEESESSVIANVQILRFAQNDKKDISYRIIVFLSLFFFLTNSYAQFRDSAKTEKKAEADTSGFHMSKNPWLSLGLSAVLPGAGQIYTGG